jgi:hypothetical protein
MHERGLFGKLLKLKGGTSVPLEDYFTEIVAHFLQHSRRTCKDWLMSLNVEGLDFTDETEIHVSTQVHHVGLEHHDKDSRVDLCIDLNTGEEHDRVVVESKIGSEEHDDQLTRYAELLAARSGQRRKVLVYITRDYEPKPKLSQEGVDFIQCRWKDFYRVLEEVGHADECEDLRKELMTFMKEHHMEDRNQFEAVDLLTLSNLVPAIELVKLTLGDDVQDMFRKTLGGVSKPIVNLAIGRCAISTSFGNQIECVLGCWFRSWNDQPLPMVGIHLNVSGSKPDRVEIGNALKDLAHAREWRPYGDLSGATGFGGIGKERDLRTFLGAQDHIRAIKEFFRDLLDEVDEIMQQYPELRGKEISPKPDKER